MAVSNAWHGAKSLATDAGDGRRAIIRIVFDRLGDDPGNGDHYRDANKISGSHGDGPRSPEKPVGAARQSPALNTAKKAPARITKPGPPVVLPQGWRQEGE